MKKTELLSPAGNYDCLKAAFCAGADAVYLGGKNFGARAFASNFESDELLDALSYAHLLSKKLYLTCNTLIKETEFSALYDYLGPLYDNGLDGIIIQDFGLIPYIRKEFPLLPVHASTQMTVNHEKSARFLKENGVTRIVPSRELSLEEVLKIKESAGVEVEVFIHGAMCYSYSGQCLLSSFWGGRSGNRGKCAQPCRLSYHVIKDNQCISKNGENYLLSLKDLCAIDHIGQLLDNHIDSFKIEGRMKSAEYVAGVTSIYRKYIDEYYQTRKVSIWQEDRKRLRELYVRCDVQDGYYSRHNGRSMITLTSPSYRTADKNSLNDIHKRYCEKEIRLPISANCVFIPEQKSSLTLFDSQTSVTCYGDMVEKAKSRPITQDEIKKQITKTGNTPFIIHDFSVKMDETSFISVKSLNDLRRAALKCFEEKKINAWKRDRIKQCQTVQDVLPVKTDRAMTPVKEKIDRKDIKLTVQVMDYAQFKAALSEKPDRIYLPSDLFYKEWINQTKGRKNSLLREEMIQKGSCEIFLSLPRILRQRDKDYFVFLKKLISQIKFDGILIKNLEELFFLRELSYQGKIASDHNLYTYNKNAIVFLKENGVDQFCLPLELNRHEMVKISDVQSECVVYGHMPVMVSANCVLKTTGNCNRAIYSFGQFVVDRYNRKMPVFCNCIHCYNIIYNSVPHSLHRNFADIMEMGPGQIRLDMTVETDETVSKIIRYYKELYQHHSHEKQDFLEEYTMGHYRKGVE